MINEFKHYYEVARKMQHIKFEGNAKGFTKNDVGDDLAWNVPIYDVVNRRYAAFSSFPEALWHKHADPKGNGQYFKANTIPRDVNFASLCYLFRLCGSGINYIPAKETPWGSHGFGNFWLVDTIRKGYYRRDSWIDHLPDKRFCDVKGYMLPLIKGGIRPFIADGFAYKLVDEIWTEINSHAKTDKYEIYEIVNLGNKILKDNGYQRQNFVLCAFAMDLAEYFPSLVDSSSRVIVGSNAAKCLRLIFPTRRGVGRDLGVTNEALQELCAETGHQSKNYDMEDVACDFIRYIENYQSPDHIKANGGQTFKNSL